MLKSLFKRKNLELESNSPMVRATLRRLSGVPDESATGRAIQDTESVMREAMTVVGNDLINQNEATRGTSIYFFTGTAIGYCLKHGVSKEDTSALQFVVQTKVDPEIRTTV